MSGQQVEKKNDTTNVLFQHLAPKTDVDDDVIFEDLDSFKYTEIFTKLRELNTLINNYENINQKLVFIYALRDDAFEDKLGLNFLNSLFRLSLL